MTNTWTKHALASLISAAWASGAVYYMVPESDQKYAWGAIMFLAYIVGVALPTPTKPPTVEK